MADSISLSLTYQGEQQLFPFPADATITDLSSSISTSLDIPPERQKLLITPRPGLLRPPFKDPTLALSTVLDRKITLLGSSNAVKSDLDAAIATRQEQAKARDLALRKGRTVKAYKSVDSAKVRDEAMYTFHDIRPLPHLNAPERSQAFLQRLAADPGIKSSMRKHHFAVGLLTEMDPAEHTTHESRTLGLNRNKGQSIELRLRTDAYDGYRDYKVIRKTLCHELAHNVFGDHDSDFWALCKAIEQEVERGDWTRGGNAVGDQEYYEALPQDTLSADHGGWTGGAHVLGGDFAESLTSKASTSEQDVNNRRELMARAADARMRTLQGKKDLDPPNDTEDSHVK